MAPEGKDTGPWQLDYAQPSDQGQESRLTENRKGADPHLVGQGGGESTQDTLSNHSSYYPG